ncbi:Helix-turn-helix domain-containing protein [Ruminococcaceae bacterium FB2012]|nr:Helix-turn-helix domain-containing protein [Ruminococcaceae bacterium FB2012]
MNEEFDTKLENYRQQLEHLLRKCPDILTPAKAAKWSPLGKNKVYELLKSGELRSFTYQGGYIISKADLIDYLAAHCDDSNGRRFKVGGSDD